MQQQAVGGGQQDLEEHEQVEQVAGEEGAVEPHQLELEQRMEMHACAVPARAWNRARPRRRARRSAPASGPTSRSATSTMPKGAAPVAGAGRRRSSPARRRCGRRRPQRSSAIAATRPIRFAARLSAALSAAALLAQQQHQRRGDQRQRGSAPHEVWMVSRAGEEGMAVIRRPPRSPSTWSVPRQAARGQQHDQEQRRGREADDDGRQHERLRQRVGVAAPASAAHARRSASARCRP